MILSIGQSTLHSTIEFEKKIGRLLIALQRAKEIHGGNEILYQL